MNQCLNHRNLGHVRMEMSLAFSLYSPEKKRASYFEGIMVAFSMLISKLIALAVNIWQTTTKNLPKTRVKIQEAASRWRLVFLRLLNGREC